ncbi:MAG TPA: diadenylate cyclase CdaA [Bacilli bacterium]|nr:MAG: DisA bacterial checkpoint controller nucleotide-binding protein [Tenericutes bacterium ADurb.BinA124]HPX83793.1 diadenylate cyclase CdaA [Bacilli bacterium]HQC73904.1 diadenylate cyclase CdaA [Bacilli bacterium]
MMNWTDFLKLIEDYTYNYSFWGFVRLGADLALTIGLLIFLYKVFNMKAHVFRLLIGATVILLIFFIGLFFQLELFLKLFRYILFWIFGLFIIVYGQDIKYTLDGLFSATKINTVYSSKQEKKEIIGILCSTVDFLSQRKIGALITIEREDSLNSYIEKAIEIKATITQELLTTIFTPGTACHDGAVIIRRNRIMCAGAYFPSTDRYNVPKFLGTRHRAAIGISERSDALTVVVSEETGNISVTLDGVINLQLTIDRLEEMLDRYLVSK